MHISPLQGFSPDDLFSGRAAALAEYYNEHRALLSRAELEFASEADGRVSLGGQYVYAPLPAEVTLVVGASLITAKPERPSGMSSTGGAIGLRGTVTSFSDASRRRMMRLIATTRRDERPLFVTLTYPDKFPDDKVKWKRDLDTFGKRFRRQFPDASFVWRIEFKSRRSGSSEGLVAPHYHLLAWGVSIVDFRAFGDSAWYSVVGSGDADHLLAGVSSERVRKWGGTMSYVSKYVAKLQDFPEGWAGRVWGVVGRENLPLGVSVTVSLLEKDGIKLIRLGRKLIGLKGRFFPFGLTFIANVERVLDYLEFLVGFT